MSEFKDMKFLVAGDEALASSVITLLTGLGYSSYSHKRPNKDIEVIVTYKDGDFISSHLEENYHGYAGEEINIDWMRSNKPKTIELDNKTYEELMRIKAELEEALKHIKPVE